MDAVLSTSFQLMFKLRLGHTTRDAENIGPWRDNVLEAQDIGNIGLWKLKMRDAGELDHGKGWSWIYTAFETPKHEVQFQIFIQQ